MTVVESAVQWAIKTANDNSHGYSQASRWGPDYDCASFVIEAYEQAGVPLRKHGANTTRDMRPAMIACGFVDVTHTVGLKSGYGIQSGDVLLNEQAHTCISIGDGKVANCRTDEGHPQTGDQGQEIRIQAYWDFPWGSVLRYKGSQSTTSQVNSGSNSGANQSKPSTGADSSQATDKEDHRLQLPTISLSNAYNSYCVMLQSVLNARHWACGSADGFFGAKTFAAVTKAQRYFGLEADGVVGPKTWNKLLDRG